MIVRGRDAGAGGDWKNVLEVVAAEDGSYSGRLRPNVGARYQARAAADQLASNPVDVAVKPKVTIAVSRRVAPAGSTLTVTGRILPGGAVDRADLVGYDQRRKRWVTLTTRAVAKSGKVVFRVKLEEGANRLKISFWRGSTSAGYTPAESRFVRVLGTLQNEHRGVIVLHADDFGASADTVRATIECFEGALTSASIMPAMPATAEAVEFARAHPDLDVGVHLTFVGEGDERPLSPPEEIPGLVDEHGRSRRDRSACVRSQGAYRSSRSRAR